MLPDDSSVKADQVWVVVPAFNEGEIIASVVSDLRVEGYRVVVVDDGSVDDTSERALRSTAHVCRHIMNLGQGAALQTGIRYALARGAEYVVTFDGDGQHGCRDIRRLLQALMTEKTDVALGTRFKGEGRAVGIPPARRLLLKIATAYTRLTVRIRVTDTHNGLRAFTRSAASKLDITQNRMAHATQILGQIREHGMRYAEVPVTIYYTEYSLKKGQTMVNSVNVLWESLVELLRR